MITIFERDGNRVVKIGDWEYKVQYDLGDALVILAPNRLYDTILLTRESHYYVLGTITPPGCAVNSNDMRNWFKELAHGDSFQIVESLETRQCYIAVLDDDGIIWAICIIGKSTSKTLWDPKGKIIKDVTGTPEIFPRIEQGKLVPSG